MHTCGTFVHTCVHASTTNTICFLYPHARMRELKGLACRTRVTPASSPASSAQRSRRLHSTRAAAPVLFAHAFVLSHIKKTDGTSGIEVTDVHMQSVWVRFWSMPYGINTGYQRNCMCARCHEEADTHRMPRNHSIANISRRW